MRITELIDAHGIPLAVLLAQYPAAKRCETPSLELLVSALSAIRNALTSRLRSALLLKPVAASAVDRVCRFSANVFVQSRLIARAVTEGEPLPAWRGAARSGAANCSCSPSIRRVSTVAISAPFTPGTSSERRSRSGARIRTTTKFDPTALSTARVPDDENWRIFSLRLAQRSRARWYVVRRI